MAFQKKEKKVKQVPSKDLAELVKQIKAKCGVNSVTTASDYKAKPIQRISSGLLQVDWALGGGWPKGRVNLLAGEPSSCKSRLAYAMVADAQRRSRFTNQYLFEKMEPEHKVPNVCLWIDVEGAHTNEWAQSCGVDCDALLLAQPKNQEEACELILTSLGSNQVDLIVVDSIDALLPEEMFDQTFDEATYGTLAAKNNSKLLRKIQSLFNKQRQEDENVPTCLFLNHVKVDINKGNKTYPGGVAQRFYASVVVETSPGKVEYADSQRKVPKYRDYYFRVEKNKVAIPYRQGTFQMALSNDANAGVKAGEFLELQAIMKMCQHFGCIEQTEDKKVKFFDEEFDSVKEFGMKYFSSMKEDLLTKRRLLDYFLTK